MPLFMIEMDSDKESLYFDAKDMKDANAKAEDYYRRTKGSKRGKVKQLSKTKMATVEAFKGAVLADGIADKFSESK